jgi:hypothetical protein
VALPKIIYKLEVLGQYFENCFINKKGPPSPDNEVLGLTFLPQLIIVEVVSFTLFITKF